MWCNLREGPFLTAVLCLLQPVPQIRGRCWQQAARRSFFSRDNTENFITFCRDLGVHENLLFESDDLGTYSYGANFEEIVVNICLKHLAGERSTVRSTSTHFCLDYFLTLLGQRPKSEAGLDLLYHSTTFLWSCSNSDHSGTLSFFKFFTTQSFEQYLSRTAYWTRRLLQIHSWQLDPFPSFPHYPSPKNRFEIYFPDHLGLRH